MTATIPGTLRYPLVRPRSIDRNADMRGKSKIVGALPAAVRAPRAGCVRCVYLAHCRIDGPACEGTILVKMSSGEVVRM
jgi:hypothetical protein